jgi:hypothetical protein
LLGIIGNYEELESVYARCSFISHANLILQGLASILQGANIILRQLEGAILDTCRAGRVVSSSHASVTVFSSNEGPVGVRGKSHPGKLFVTAEGEISSVDVRGLREHEVDGHLIGLKMSVEELVHALAGFLLQIKREKLSGFLCFHKRERGAAQQGSNGKFL